jgi:hypothetical protein
VIIPSLAAVPQSNQTIPSGSSLGNLKINPPDCRDEPLWLRPFIVPESTDPQEHPDFSNQNISTKTF